jgi:hypothetical protein
MPIKFVNNFVSMTNNYDLRSFEADLKQILKQFDI